MGVSIGCERAPRSRPSARVCRIGAHTPAAANVEQGGGGSNAREKLTIDSAFRSRWAYLDNATVPESTLSAAFVVNFVETSHFSSKIRQSLRQRLPTKSLKS